MQDKETGNGCDSQSRNHNPNSTEKHVEEKEYGWFSFKPRPFQFCNNPKGFLIVYCLFITIATSMNGGILYTNISALETRFKLTSSQSGIIVAGYDIGFCIFSVFVTYFGDRFNRARLVAGGAVLFGFSCLLYSLPHFTTSLYNTGGDLLSITCNKTFEPDCSYEVDESSNFYLLLFACIIMGIGLTPPYTLGLSYIEDSVPKQSASLYLGIANCALFLGSMIGFLSGGTFLANYYVDFDSVSISDVTLGDPRWVGAWWVMPLVVMSFSWIFAIPLFGFPKQMPGTAKIRASRVSEVHKLGASDIVESHGFGEAVKVCPSSIWTLLKNPTFVLSTLGDCAGGLVLSGITAFYTKFLENNFHLPLGNAALLSGVTTVPAAIVGSLTGALIVYKFQWTPRGMLRLSTLSTIAVAVLSPYFLLSCENLPVSGISAPYSHDASKLLDRNLTSPCNDLCRCQGEFFVSSCSSDGDGYFSPCHAGCTDIGLNNSQPVFTNCSCTNSSVTIGSCPSDCSTLAPFVVLSMLNIFFIFVSFTPTILTTFRVVPENLRSFGLGVKLILVRVLGSIPGPILYGSFVDISCNLWQTRLCGGNRGSCLIYESMDMAVYFIIITAVCSSVSALFYFLAGCVYQPHLTKSVEEGKPHQGHNNGQEKEQENTNAIPNPGFVED